MLSRGLTGMPMTLLPLRLIYPRGYLGDRHPKTRLFAHPGLRHLGIRHSLKGSYRADTDDHPDRDPDAGGPQLPGPRRRGRVRGRPAARHRPGPRAGGPRAGADHARVRDPHPQRLRHRRPGPGGAHGAAYFVNADDDVVLRPHARSATARSCRSARRMRVRALATPGHTFTHLSYALDGRTVQPVGGVHRRIAAVRRHRPTGPARPEHTHDLAHAPVRLRAPPGRPSCPTTPGCSRPTASAASARPPSPRPPTSTIGQEQPNQPGPDRRRGDATSRELLAGLDAYPAYYAHMAPANAAGTVRAGPDPAGAGRRRRSCGAGSRPGSGWWTCATARPSPPGTCPASLNFGIDGAFATYLGWLIDWGTPITLLGETEDEVPQAQRELVRIGIDRPAAAATGTPQDWTDRAAGARSAHSHLRRPGPGAPPPQCGHPRRPARRAEFATARIEGALNIPLHELPRRVHEVPDGEVWVHCAGGYRASVAASFLAAAGRTLVAIDDTSTTPKDRPAPHHR